MEKLYGLWTPKNNPQKIEDCLSSGIWHRGECPDPDYERDKIAEMVIGADVFLYEGVEDVLIKDSPFAPYLSTDVYDANRRVVKVKCHGVGKLKVTDPDSLSVEVEWQLDYQGSEWFVNFRQDGVWTLKAKDIQILQPVIFDNQVFNYEKLAKSGCFDRIKNNHEEVNVEQAFSTWLANQINGNGIPYSDQTGLVRDLRETIPSWDEVMHDNIFNVREADTANTLYQRCRANGNLHAKSMAVGNGRPMLALKKYKEFLESFDAQEEVEAISMDGEQNNTGVIAPQLNQILYGPPGTGKTYNTVNLALDILGADDEQKESIKSIKTLQKAFGSQVEFVTFHQSFSYEDFVEGLKAVPENGQISYKVESGIFKTICDNARNSGNDSLDKLHQAIEQLKEQVTEEPLSLKTQARSKPFVLNYYGGDAFYAKPDAGKWENPASIKAITEVYKNPSVRNGESGVYFRAYTLPIIEYLKNEYGLKEYQEKVDDKYYVLIIDEINRGNISRILGELITLIEPSKRAGAEEEISVTLPYSKESFSVPNNLHIIGTMNTADRSLAQVDTALRRRFEFKEMMPNHTLEQISTGCDGVDLQKLLKAINERIEYLHNRDHMIGHSFLMGINELEELQNKFANHILPLLEEYFFEDWQKIKAVLNEYDNENGAFYAKKNQPDDLPAEYKNEDTKIYRRTSKGDWDANSFMAIYGAGQQQASNQTNQEAQLDEE